MSCFNFFYIETSRPTLLPTTAAPVLTPNSDQNAPGLSAGAIAGICVGTVVTAVASALLLVYNYHNIKAKALKNILQIRVSQKVHVESSPDMDMDAEYGPQNSPKAGLNPGSMSMSTMDDSQSTILDVHVVSAAEDMANELPQQPTWSELQSSITSSFLQSSVKYQPLVVEEADKHDP